VNDFENSFQFLSDCVRINPDYTPAYYSLAMTLKEMGREQEAARYETMGEKLSKTKGRLKVQDDKISLRLF